LFVGSLTVCKNKGRWRGVWSSQGVVVEGMSKERIVQAGGTAEHKVSRFLSGFSASDLIFSAQNVDKRSDLIGLAKRV
jgi:hypothetical protein